VASDSTQGAIRHSSLMLFRSGPHSKAHNYSVKEKKQALLPVLLFLRLRLGNAYNGTSNFCQVTVVIRIVVIRVQGRTGW